MNALNGRDVIARGVFTSVTDLKRKLMRYIRQYNKQPKTVKWKYFDPSRRITPESIVTVHYENIHRENSPLLLFSQFI
jgi:hypothetical protein